MFCVFEKVRNSGAHAVERSRTAGNRLSKSRTVTQHDRTVILGRNKKCSSNIRGLGLQQ